MYLVISHTHGLLPFAYRLKLEGEDVEPLVLTTSFEGSWKGKMNKILRNSQGQIDQEHLAPVIQKAESGEVTVITDSWSIQTIFQNAKKLFGVQRPDNPPKSVFRVGGWVFQGELHAPHVLVTDVGAWPGNIGPDVDGGMTLIRIDNPEIKTFIQQKFEEVSLKEFQGLVQFGVEFATQSGAPEVSGVQAGWPTLHTHAFLSELDHFGLILEGSRVPELPKKFVTVIPVSQPPWPNHQAKLRKRKEEVKGLTPKQMSRVFWHDVVMDDEHQSITTGGTDGFIGVARGAANTSELSRRQALEIAVRINIPERQFRLDTGTSVQGVLADLENVLGLSL